jgi:5-methylcytosine-specific restriction endonuclease McrA
MGWYEERFIENPKRVACSCLNCGRAFWLPKCEAQRRHTCGRACAAELRARRLNERRRPCAHCGSVFLPRSNQVSAGEGRFCSISCSVYGNGQLWSKPARETAAASLRSAIASGLYVPPKGESHHQWKGGPAATSRRAQESGRAAERLREYRRKNPHKVREFAKSRTRRKHGRLPKGTVAKIGAAQRWRCAVCRDSIKREYHVDHIEPLARGGKHEPKNIQLLCPPCNVRKSARDPIDFMQMRGFLL